MRHGFGASGSDGGAARRSKFAHVSGMGTLDDGWTIEIVSGLEEARLIHLGLVSAGRARREERPGWWISEAAVANHAVPERTTPRYGEPALGAVRLTGEFLQHRSARKGD